MEIYMNVLKKYAVFHGRANRTEYWVFFLVNILIMLVLGFIEGALGIAEYTDQSMLAVYYQLFIIIPTIAVGVRRMHDVDKSGWWLIVPFLNLIFALSKGTNGSNRFGELPK